MNNPEQRFSFTLAKEDVVASGITVRKEFPESGGVVFSPLVPKNYRYPSLSYDERRPLKKNEPLTLASPVERIEGLTAKLRSAEKIFFAIGKKIKSNPGTKEKYERFVGGEVYYWPETHSMRLVIRPLRGKWHLPVLPEPLPTLFASSLRHEAAINRDLPGMKCIFDIRFHRPQGHTHTDSKTHFDFTSLAKDPDVSKYFFGTAPTSVQYEHPRFTQEMIGKTPEEAVEQAGLAASSLLPEHIYRVNHRFLHSSPEDFFPEVLGTEDALRVFGGIAFRKR